MKTYGEEYEARKRVKTVLIVYYVHIATYIYKRAALTYISSAWSVQRVCIPSTGA
jgi:hypothetical protein